MMIPLIDINLYGDKIIVKNNNCSFISIKLSSEGTFLKIIISQITKMQPQFHFTYSKHLLTDKTRTKHFIFYQKQYNKISIDRKCILCDLCFDKMYSPVRVLFYLFCLLCIRYFYASFACKMCFLFYAFRTTVCKEIYFIQKRYSDKYLGSLTASS